MIFDAEELTAEELRHPSYDVCVIGSGPAGITLARRLASRGARVGLLEAGELQPSPQSQELYGGRLGGRPYFSLEGTRLRYFGGSSNHWGGWTRPLDEHDFHPRDGHPLSGWPIRKADLDPYAAEADRILDLPPHFTPPDLFHGRADGVTAEYFRFSHPVTRFGPKYHDELQQSAAIEVFLNANLVDLRLDATHRRVAGALFRCYSRPDLFEARARHFVLCLGGIENPRLLLNADRQLAHGLGNEHGLVGRYFMDHPHVPVGRVVTREPMTRMLVYSPSRQFMRRHQVLSFGFRLGNFALVPDRKGFTGEFMPQPECTIPFEALLGAEMRGESAACPAHAGQAFVVCEQALNAASRVRLGTDRDRFGLARCSSTGNSRRSTFAPSAPPRWRSDACWPAWTSAV